jgi:hypothetical protein
MFPAHSHSFVDSYRDFRIMEKKRRQPDVFTAEGWCRLEEMTSKKKAFTVMGMKAKGYKC